MPQITEKLSILENGKLSQKVIPTGSRCVRVCHNEMDPKSFLSNFWGPFHYDTPSFLREGA